MNTISASAPPTRVRPRRAIAKMVGKMGALIAPNDHAGRGNWSKEAAVPLWAWPAGIAFVLFMTCGWDVLAWLLRFVL